MRSVPQPRPNLTNVFLNHRPLGARWALAVEPNTGHSQINDFELLNSYLRSLLKKYLNIKEYEVLRLSYGLDCDKLSAKEIADKIGIKGNSAYVRVSQLKKQAIDKLKESADYSQVIDYL